MDLRIALAALAATALPAHAECTWQWLCSGEGQCKQTPVCDSVYETPPPRPESAPPTPPPIAMRPHAIAPTMGTLACEHVMQQQRSGRWKWVDACFCADEMKAPDPTKPLANIVRCPTPWKEPEPPAPQPAEPGRAPA